ncbi:MAG: HAMP domain-containing histidine kinase [Candidatus Dormibacteraeota bacterium]|nr:HAMP domain-containing histidine kinase [Candidatus Dormibacteraeota bacterium]
MGRDTRSHQFESGGERWALARPAGALRRAVGPLMRMVGRGRAGGDRPLLEAECGRLQEVDAARSAFLRLAAHEIRRPLALIRGYLEMAAAGGTPEADALARQSLERATERMGDLEEIAGQMTEMARLREGPAQLQERVLDLRGVVDDAVRRSAPLAGPAHRLAVRNSPWPARVLADEVRLRTVLVNLLENAIKYSPGGGEVSISTSLENGLASVSVSDQGVGIDPNRRHELFQPFTRAGDRGVSGVGLGLHVAMEVVRAHGGTLRVLPNRVAGTTFVMTLPAAGAA